MESTSPSRAWHTVVFGNGYAFDTWSEAHSWLLHWQGPEYGLLSLHYEPRTEKWLVTQYVRLIKENEGDK